MDIYEFERIEAIRQGIKEFEQYRYENNPEYRAKVDRNRRIKKKLLLACFVFALMLAVLASIIALANLKENTFTYDIELNTRYTEEYVTSNTFHHFKFTVPKSGIITPYFDVGDSIFSNPDGYIISADNSDEFFYKNYNTSSNDQYVYLEPGEYELIVGANCLIDRSKTFTIGLDYEEVKPKKEKENNNTFKKAVSIEKEKYYLCNFSSEDDVDVFKVNIKDGDYLLLDLSSTASLGTFTGKIGMFSSGKRHQLTDQNCFNIEVYYSDDLDVPVFETQCIGVYKKGVPVASDGTYYIKISSDEVYYDGDYVFIASSVLD